MMEAGRPSKFTEETRKAIIQEIADGSTKHHAAGAAGIGRTTLFKWIKRGKAEKSGEYRDFMNDIKKAISQAVIKHVKKVVKASDEHWQAAAWWLERSHPNDYGSQRLEIAQMKKQIAELERMYARLHGTNNKAQGQVGTNGKHASTSAQH